jgi:hypothetical protein
VILCKRSGSFVDVVGSRDRLRDDDANSAAH